MLKDYFNYFEGWAVSRRKKEHGVSRLSSNGVHGELFATDVSVLGCSGSFVSFGSYVLL